jgi:hypothetical protein
MLNKMKMGTGKPQQASQLINLYVHMYVSFFLNYHCITDLNYVTFTGYMKIDILIACNSMAVSRCEEQCLLNTWGHIFFLKQDCVLNSVP